MRLAVFEISNSHVLCEKQLSQPCRAVDLDQSEQVLAIINNHCGPVFCDSKFKLKTPTTTRAQWLHNGEVVSRYGLPHSYLLRYFWRDARLCFSFTITKLCNLPQWKGKVAHFYFSLKIYCNHSGLSSPFFLLDKDLSASACFSRCHLHSFIHSLTSINYH